MDYSRFDNIQCSSDEEDEPAARPPQPPPNVMDDLEDYFRRMDERRAEQEAEGGNEGSQAPMSVDRLDEQQLASLKAVCFTEGSSSYSECSPARHRLSRGSTWSATRRTSHLCIEQ